MFHWKSKKAVECCEKGRSMVEMFGVLAIIGVLSVGGIISYRYAMNKYRANEIVSEINIISHQLATTLLSRKSALDTLPLEDFYVKNERLRVAEYKFKAGFLTDDVVTGYETTFYFELEKVPFRICQNIINTGEDMQNLDELKVNNGAGCKDQAEGNTITFNFDPEIALIIDSDEAD